MSDAQNRIDSINEMQEMIEQIAVKLKRVQSRTSGLDAEFNIVNHRLDYAQDQLIDISMSIYMTEIAEIAK